MTDEARQMLIDKIDDILASEEEEFFGVKKNPEKERILKDMIECASALLKVGKISAYKVSNDNNKPSAMVQVIIDLPTVYTGYDYSVDLLADMFIKADAVSYTQEEEQTSGNVIVSFMIKDFWME